MVDASAPADVVGRTAISATALRSAARAVAATALHVARGDVTCRLSDDGGRLVVELELPAHLSLMGLASRLDAARVAVRDRFATISGADIAAVRLRISAWQPAPERRVT
ncbi:MAG: hypothetical protein ACXIUP_04735 [Microcella sp.]